MCGPGSGEDTADLKRSFFFFVFPSEPTLVFTSRPVSFMGRDGGRRGGTRKGTIVQLVLLCWFHPWLRTPVVQLCTTNTHPPWGSSGSLRRSVPSLSGDQGLTNDVYAVVLVVDICWQNRSPVRHLEWN